VFEGHLFRTIATTLRQIREKPLHFCKGFFSLVSVWSGRRGSNPRPFAWEARANYEPLGIPKSIASSPHYERRLCWS